MDAKNLANGAIRRPAGAISRHTPVADVIRRDTLLAHIHCGVAPDDQWRAGLRRICQDARAELVPPEQLLRELKEALRAMFDSCGVPYSDARTAFAGRVVSLCIEEYYADRGLDA